MNINDMVKARKHGIEPTTALPAVPAKKLVNQPGATAPQSPLAQNNAPTAQPKPNQAASALAPNARVTNPNQANNGPIRPMVITGAQVLKTEASAPAQAEALPAEQMDAKGPVESVESDEVSTEVVPVKAAPMPGTPKMGYSHVSHPTHYGEVAVPGESVKFGGFNARNFQIDIWKAGAIISAVLITYLFVLPYFGVVPPGAKAFVKETPKETKVVKEVPVKAHLTEKQTVQAPIAPAPAAPAPAAVAPAPAPAAVALADPPTLAAPSATTQGIDTAPAPAPAPAAQAPASVAVPAPSAMALGLPAPPPPESFSSGSGMRSTMPEQASAPRKRTVQKQMATEHSPQQSQPDDLDKALRQMQAFTGRH